MEAKIDDSWGIQGSTGIRNIDLEIIKPEAFIQEVSTGSNRLLLIAAGIGVLILSTVFIISAFLRKRAIRASVTSDIKPEEPPQEVPETPITQITDKLTSIGISRPQNKTDHIDKTHEQITPVLLQETPTSPTHHYGSLHKLDNDNTPPAPSNPF